jgi:hypothetical protein
VQAAALAAAAKYRAADHERRQTKCNGLADRLTVEAKALADLEVKKAAMEGERRKVEADLGLVRYLATLLGADNETVLRWFILAVALLLDPAAVLRHCTDDAKHQLNTDDLNKFVGVLNGTRSTNVPLGVLSGPFRVPGNAYIPDNIDLFVGKAVRFTRRQCGRPGT